jgi:hypothetical protein
MQKAANISGYVLVAGFCKTKPTCSHGFKQMIREWVLMNESSRHPRAYVPVMEDAACTAVPVLGPRTAEGLARSRLALETWALFCLPHDSRLQCRS